MTYPSQPGYPSPYGQQQPPGRQQNTLWLVGGAIVVVLMIIMAVVLVLVQQSAGGSDGGNQGNGGDGSDGGNVPEGMDAVEFTQDSCAEYDLSPVEDAAGEEIDEESASFSFSSTDSYENVTCSFYLAETYNYISLNLWDYETLEEVLPYIESDADYYGADSTYEFSEYDEYGDAGTVYSNVSDPTYQTTYVHVALSSLEVTFSMSYDANEIERDAVVAALGELVGQTEVLFANQL